MDDPREIHRSKCLEFFKDRYGQRVQYYGLTAYGMPTKSSCSVDPLLPYLLNDKSFYQGRLYICHTARENPIANALWEAMGMSPDDYTLLVDMMSSPRCRFWTIIHEEAFSNTTHPRYHKEMTLGELLHCKPTIITFWDTIMASYALSSNTALIGRDTNRRAVGEFWPLKPVRQNNHMYPLEFGLMVYMEEQWKNVAWVFLDCAVPEIPNLDTLGDVESSLMDRIANDKVFGESEKRETPRSVHVLFSSAGTGKTRQIFELLQKQWGFYLLAPNLAPTTEQSKNEGMDMIDTKRYSASRDTYSMFADHPQMIPKWISNETNVFRPLIVARVALLYEFLRRYPSPTPRQWLWLQISCETCDPFDALYRLFRLSADQYLWWDEYVYVWAEIPGFIVHKCYSFLSKHPDQLFKASLYHCFDEAQLTLDDPQTSSMLRHLYETLTLMYITPWSGHNTEERADEDMEDQESDAMSLQTSDDMPYIDPILVISGTSLRLEVLKEKLAKYSSDAWAEPEETMKKWDSYRIDDTFQLVASDADFWALYEKHTTDMLKEFRTFRGDDQTGAWSRLPLLSRSGRPLPFESSEINLDMVEAWIRRPLEVPTTQELLAMMMQACSLMDCSNVSTDTSQIHLEELLESQDSEAVVSAVSLSLIQLSKADRETASERLGQSLLQLLADHGGRTMDQMASVVQNINWRVATPTRSSQDIVATLHTALRNLYIRTVIKSHSIGQRGRYRWSTVYIEELMLLYPRLASPGSTLSQIQMIIKEAESRTTVAAIDALKGQIRKMKSAGKEELVQDLFRAGIRAEMMSSPTIFVKPNFAQLVTYGFALVQKDGDTIRYTFSEPIAVRAVMEYLRTEGGNDYQDLMLQWLVHTQDDYEVRAMFGKATEWITDFSLPESQTTFKHEIPGTIWDWLRQQRSGDQASAPTFMFPDINAGPDLVFSLQKQSMNSERRNVSHLKTFAMRIEITFSQNIITRSKQAEEPGLKMQWKR
ncbi:hypothetical protein FNAPI_6735 [Fusarium napiforme]|uniref:Uncharacterized protein n=1 Tax=Fusarium napiforme TaxID=42672 RepID=A0A8H5JFX6_9HYPO|nr:hypothetical protein FNAPI_6735 [Fusarium napiforme]